MATRLSFPKWPWRPLKASFTVDGNRPQFVEGHELPAAMAKRVPDAKVGRLLTAVEAERILDAVEG